MWERERVVCVRVVYESGVDRVSVVFELCGRCLGGVCAVSVVCGVCACGVDNPAISSPGAAAPDLL